MTSIICPNCNSINEFSARTCMICGVELPRVKLGDRVRNWLKLETIRQKLNVVVLIFAIPFFFGPMTVVGILVFPAFTMGFAGEYLFELLNPISGVYGGIATVVGGWLIYLCIVIGILRTRNQKLIRIWVLSLITLVIWNTAGCYQIVSHIQ